MLWVRACLACARELRAESSSLRAVRERKNMQPMSWGRSRRVLGALAVLSICLGIAACGSSGKSSTTLTIGDWGAPIDEATQKAYTNQFDAENNLKSQFVDAPGVQLARVEAQNQAKQIQWDVVDSLDGGSAH